MPGEKAKRDLGRRSFLRKSGLAAGGAAGIAAMSPFARALTTTDEEDRARLALTRESILPRAEGAALQGTADPSGKSSPRDDTSKPSEAAATVGPALSRQFARWVSGLRYEDLPPAVIDRAKGLTLQALTS